MKLNKFIAVLFAGIACSQVKAQLTYGNEQFLFNPVSINPSVAGLNNNQIKLGYDTRWTGIDGAPKTGYINYDRLFNGNTGWNVALISDRIGPISTVTLSNSFAFMVNTSSETKLSFGLRHNLSQSYLSMNNNVIDGNDPLLPSNQTGVPVNNFDASVSWLNPNVFFVGFSYRNLIPQPRFRYNNTNVEPILSMQGWYTHDFGEASLEAFTMVSASINSPVNTSIGAMGAFQHKVGLGLNFSPKNQIGIFTYIKLTEKLNAFYNFNYPLSDISKASSQSHGIGLSFRLGQNTLSGQTFFIQPTNESTRTRMF
ncbi:MAG: hypothetical protein CFE21_13260 [Bacteroidetes bacterium B1(2017)]|nr:MAG: hypothetical protein CFE21_13260 [Bacteroidetes bacterium B1(2017)]